MIFFLVLALAVSLLPLVATSVPWAFSIGMGAFFVAIALLFRWAARSAAAKRKLLTSGVPGTATVIRRKETGVYVGAERRPVLRFTLEVEDPVHGKRRLEHQEAPPILWLSKVAADAAKLAVRVDPADANRLAIDWEGRAGEDDEAEKRRILETGDPGTMTVREASDSGETHWDGQRLFDVEVVLDLGGKTYGPAKTRLRVAPERASRVAAGAVLPVRYDPGRPEHMAVDWEAAG